jgi:hypothetical protein
MDSDTVPTTVAPEGTAEPSCGQPKTKLCPNMSTTTLLFARFTSSEASLTSSRPVVKVDGADSGTPGAKRQRELTAKLGERYGCPGDVTG